MTDATEHEDAFKNRVANAARTLSACAGYFIDRISFDAFAQEDSMEIALRGGPWKPDVVISLSNLHQVSVAKGPELSGSFIDEISLIHLPKMPHPWPDDAIGRLPRFGGLSEFAWLRIIGPAEVEAIASIVTVYTAMSDAEATSAQQTA
ncbi:hypothetical protein ACH47Z_41135 [Streptomyces sp. NPDC020192]|uniref:hypothetical protein n=1 Tax=Streptomyces sp. NPDC020192 TaxID=3365066 RepID=UPI003791ECD4